MEIYALVGPSGTGKSYRALELAYDNEIDYIIDDGILIHNNKILSGISAKQANTTMEAVKRAIFLNIHHRKEVKTKIQEEKVKKILVIGTSVKMVNQIADRLELGKIEKYIDIKEISTQEEINEAKSSRKKGNHIIPVPTMEMKQITSGLKIESLKKKLFRKNSKTEEVLEKTIIRPTFSYIGKFFISPNIIEDIIKYEIGKNEYIDKINKIEIKNINNIISLKLNVNLNNAEQIKKCKNLQEEIKTNIEKITSINVEKIDIYISKIRYK